MTHTVDSTHHPRGEAALWEEVCRLRRLVREGERLIRTLELLALADFPSLHNEARGWRAGARRELQ